MYLVLDIALMHPVAKPGGETFWYTQKLKIDE